MLIHITSGGTATDGRATASPGDVTPSYAPVGCCIAIGIILVLAFVCVAIPMEMVQSLEIHSGDWEAAAGNTVGMLGCCALLGVIAFVVLYSWASGRTRIK